MDEKQLKKMLSEIEPPEPDASAREEAVLYAVEAFEKNKDSIKGSAGAGRHTGNTSIISRLFGRRLMQKKYVVSGMAGAVAVCALFVFAGGTYMNAFGPTYSSFEKMEFNAPTMPSQVVGAESDPVYTKAVERSNEERAHLAQKLGKSAIPTPIGEPTGRLEAPKTGDKLPSDPLAEWRRAAEPRRMIVEEAPAKRQSQSSAGEIAEFEAQAPMPAPSRADGSTMSNVTSGFGGAREKKETLARKRAPASQGMAADRIAPMPVPRPEPVPGTVVAPEEPQDTYYKDEGQDEFEEIRDNNIKLVSEEPVSTFSIDVDTASYAFVRRQINHGTLPQKDAVRIEEMINYFDYDYPLPEDASKPFEPTVAVYDSPWREGSKIMHIGIKGHDVVYDEKPRTNLVFLIDVSGSMNNPEKLPLVKQSLSMVLDKMQPDDTIGIVVYAGAAGTVLDPTPVREKRKILEAMDRLRAGGSTAGAAGIQRAYELAEASFVEGGVNRVILATDGDFNVGITNHNELKSYIERKRDTGIFLSVLGFGQGNYHDNLMQTLAQNGNGNANYIDNLNEARKVLVEEASGTLFTIAKDVKIQVEFNPSMVAEYRLIGYENRMLNREDFNNDAIDAGEVGSGHTVTAIYEITPPGSPARMVDDLRYGAKADADAEGAEGTEYAFLKIRYKLPDENESILMTRPVTTEDEQSFDGLSDDLRFAAAVAGFGQILRGGKYTGDMTLDDVIAVANAARGDDEFGYRAEFVNLVRLAKSLPAMRR